MSYASAVAANSPKLFFRMQEASGLFQDSSGLAHHATATGGNTGYQIASPIVSEPTDYATTHLAGSWHSVPDHADLDMGDTITAEAWVYPTTMATLMVISGRGSAGALTWGMNTDNTIFVAKANTAIIVSSTSTLSISTWYHVVYTKATTTSKIYINGSDVTGTVTNQTLADVTTALYVGADYDASGPWLGRLDEVAFYSTALSQTDVQTHYNAAISTGQTILPDADTAEGGWTTAPLWSKVNDSSDATIITATAS